MTDGRSWLAALLLAGAAAAGTPDAATDRAAPPRPGVPFTWHHDHATFSYVGFTVLYSCDGLESQVRGLLEYLGAREVKVHATGCPWADTAPSHTAWVDAQFDVPVPATPTDASAAAGAAAPGATAHWMPVKLVPGHPNFLGAGDCELIDGMKDLLTKTLPLRAVEFRASCFPGSVNPDGFEVSGQALEVLPRRTASARPTG